MGRAEITYQNVKPRKLWRHTAWNRIIARRSRGSLEFDQLKLGRRNDWSITSNGRPNKISCGKNAATEMPRLDYAYYTENNGSAEQKASKYRQLMSVPDKTAGIIVSVGVLCIFIIGASGMILLFDMGVDAIETRNTFLGVVLIGEGILWFGASAWLAAKWI
jgi:hypothetical protein